MSDVKVREARRRTSLPVLAGALLFLVVLRGEAWSQTMGTLHGSAAEHTPQSAANVVIEANLALPSSMTGGSAFFGKWKDGPRTEQPGPVVLFLHGSSGLNLAAIEEWQ